MTPYYADDWLTVYQGDCRAVLAEMPAESVHCVVTSPPYWGLRDYGVGGQLGLEPTPEEYVANMVAVFREVRRVLRADGTVWLNLGDSYSGSGPSGASYQSETTKRRAEGNGTDGAFRVSKRLADRGLTYAEKKPVPAPGLKPKDLVGIPWRVAFALQADGWYLRSDIIWSKPNPMPESVTDRPTKSHEYVFLLSKSARYYYDADAAREADSWQDHPRSVLQGQLSLEPSGGIRGAHKGIRTIDGRNGAGRNLRTVWTIATEPYGMATVPNRVGPDGRPGTVSPDCRVHSPQANPGTERTGGGDGRLDPPSSHSRDTESCPALGLASEQLASSIPDTSDDRRSTTGSRPLGSSDSPTPESAPASRTPSLPTGDGGQAEIAALEPRTSRSPAPATSPVDVGLWELDGDAATRRNEIDGRMNGGSGEPGWQGLAPMPRTSDRRAQREAGEARCSCLEYISMSHFATFPRKLVEPCIKAGTSERGVCPECGAPWVRVTKASYDIQGRTTNGPRSTANRETTAGFAQRLVKSVETTGWRASCSHGAEPVPAVVLDIFGGSGTTGMVAQSLSRRAVLIDLNGDYLVQAMERNRDIPLGLDVA